MEQKQTDSVHRLVGCIPTFCTNIQLVLLARGSASSLSLRCRTTSSSAWKAHTPRKASHVHGHNTKLYNRQGSGQLHWLHVRTLQSLFTAWPTSQCKPAAHTAPSSQRRRLLNSGLGTGAARMWTVNTWKFRI